MSNSDLVENNVNLDEYFEVETEAQEESIDVAQKYNAPDKKNAVIGANGSVIDYKDIDPLDVIRKFAEKQGIQLKDPKRSCKHCWGRGWIGRTAKEGAPVPCNCIYPPEVLKNMQQNIVFENRKLRRNYKYQVAKAKEQIFQIQKQQELAKKYEAQYSQKAGLPFSDIIGS